MITRFAAVVAGSLALAFAGAGDGAGHGPDVERIPEIHAAALSGTPVNLPAALDGKAGVLVIGFSQGSRAEVTAWGKVLFDDFHSSPSVAFYQMADLAGVPKLLRGLVAKKIADDVPVPAREHFVTIYDHEAEWKALAEYDRADDAYVLLVDGKGVVRWKSHGTLSDPLRAELRRRVQELQK